MDAMEGYIEQVAKPTPPSLEGNLTVRVPLLVRVDAANPASAELTLRFAHHTHTERVPVGDSRQLSLVCRFAPATMIAEPDSEAELDRLAAELSEAARAERLTAIGEPVDGPHLDWHELPEETRAEWRMFARIAAARGAR